MKTGLAGLLLMAGLPPALQAQEIWRHVDERGSVRYADRPFAGAVPAELPETSRWSGRAADASGNEERGPKAAGPRAGAGSELAIVRPAPEETVRGSGGALDVMIAAGREFEPRSRLVLELNGVETVWRGEPPKVTLSEVWRGEHRLRARLLDARGRELASSEEIRFYKREASVIKPGEQARGDSLRFPSEGPNAKL
ncbi:MAG: DUF4124 domain-containing protein [Gammaproteobacteria bacterium]|nr:DUF4124 domain-containing protein [Gammaproteobacteria bacterium]MXW46027.1 DUF4124 domain-containing protein [Gammaproteobacteria bacterium]MYD02410.1 DUF4124 domain-containing protein [Gammaproteobacteria bacterium]MYI25896.1 DUF4124 domain-containing protein [Gammaproteobacteria bacterium]